MLKRIIATAVLGGALTLGVAGVAGASPPAGATHPRCAKAPAALARIAKLEAKANAWLPKAEQREATATSEGHADVAARIERRIDRVQRLEAKGTALRQRIEAACPGASSSGTSSGTSQS